MYYYSPHTGELIATDHPADWMASTTVAPPAFDAQTAGCFWRGASWEVVQATPTAAPPKQLTSLEFLDLFTETEQLAVATAAMQSAQVKLWYDRTLAAEYITIEDPRTEAGLTSLVTNNLLTESRKNQIIQEMR